MTEMYKTAVGDMFSLAISGDVICVTTNGIIRKDGRAVMGVGTAKIARDSFKDIDLLLAKYLKDYGNRCFNLGKYNYQGKELRIVSFPTKNNYNDNSNIELIKKSIVELKEMADKFGWQRVFLPLPGVGAGNLSWSKIKEYFSVLDSRFVLISIKAEDFNS